MRIFFHCNQLSVRGTEVATYDYAYYNQTLLNNESVIVYPKNSPNNTALAAEKFGKEFELIGYDRIDDVEDILTKGNADALYVMNSGFFDGVVSKSAPTLIHAVFPVWPSAQYGAVYAFISNWLSKECANGKLPFVPYIVSLPGVGMAVSLREKLNIPADAFVVGCIASRASFDIPFVKVAITQALKRRSDLYFLFLNIDPFTDHERTRFLPAQTDLEFKARFIASCDAMLHARKRGETFGLACAEFSIANKPVLTYAYSPEINHLEILGDKAIIYRGQKDLVRWLLNANRNELKKAEWDAYSRDFAPKPVMERFRSVFLDPATRHPPIDFSLADWAAVGSFAFNRNARKLAGKVLRGFD